MRYLLEEKPLSSLTSCSFPMATDSSVTETVILLYILGCMISKFTFESAGVHRFATPRKVTHEHLSLHFQPSKVCVAIEICTNLFRERFFLTWTNFLLDSWNDCSEIDHVTRTCCLTALCVFVVVRLLVPGRDLIEPVIKNLYSGHGLHDSDSFPTLYGMFFNPLWTLCLFDAWQLWKRANFTLFKCWWNTISRLINECLKICGEILHTYKHTHTHVHL